MQEGPSHVTFMRRILYPDYADRLYDIVNEMLGPEYAISVPPITGLAGLRPPFDTSKPNQHDSKAEFLLELEAVEACLDGIASMVEKIAPREGEKKRQEMLDQLQLVIDEKMDGNIPGRRPDSGFAAGRNLAASVGGFYSTFVVLSEFRSALKARHSELKAQEAEFWSVSHRPPNYHARTIAFRLADLYFRQTGKKPTLGSSGTTGDPSTAYSIALKQTFELMEIDCGVRSPAEWAVANLDSASDPSQRLKLAKFENEKSDLVKQQIVQTLLKKGP